MASASWLQVGGATNQLTTRSRSQNRSVKRVKVQKKRAKMVKKPTLCVKTNSQDFLVFGSDCEREGDW
ncbi:hypothetical protein ABBQ38_010106 [Trebouxia sp. C0009 RCD-2024]